MSWNGISHFSRWYNSDSSNRDEQDALDRKARDEWEDKVRKNGILLDI